MKRIAQVMNLELEPGPMVLATHHSNQLNQTGFPIPFFLFKFLLFKKIIELISMKNVLLDSSDFFMLMFHHPQPSNSDTSDQVMNLMMGLVPAPETL